MANSDRINNVSRVFVGRQREMAELTAALDDALTGQGRLAMLAGEPGIGKTSTARELASRAAMRGFLVLWGRCYEEEGAPPYWPWVQLIRSYVEEADSDRLRAELGLGAADISEIVPLVRQKLPGLAAPPALEPEQARFRLLDAVTAFLKNVAQPQSVMLVLDDIHWADKPSLSLLEFLAREMGGSRMMVVAGYRDLQLSRQHPLAETLAQLSREPLYRRYSLGGLSQEVTPSLIQAATGVLPAQGLAETIFTHAEGNPYFMTEMVRLLAERGELTEERIGDAQDLRLPDGVREAIGQRLNRLSDECYEALTTASVIGRGFSLRQLERLMEGFSEDLLINVVEEAIGARIIEELAGPDEGYQFTHGLVQETLASELSTARRVRMHARIGEALEALYGTNAPDHAAELAHHFAQAEPVLGIEKRVHYSLVAGERALGVYAWEEAEVHFEQGLNAKRVPLTGIEPVTDCETAALLFGVARAQQAMADRLLFQQIGYALQRSFDYYAGLGDVDHALSVAEHPSYDFINGGDPGLLTKVFIGALALVPPDSHEAGRILSNFGLLLGLRQDDYDGAQEALGKALDIAQRDEDRPLEMRTLAHAASVDNYHLRWQEGLSRALRVTELSQGLDDIHNEVTARYFAMSMLMSVGDPTGALHHGTAILPLAERLRDRFWLGGALWKNGTVRRLAGDWQAARDFGDRSLAVRPGHHTVITDLAMLECEVGEMDKGQAYLGQLLEEMRLSLPGQYPLTHAYSAMVIPLAERITGSGYLLDVVEAAAKNALDSPSANPNVTTRARAGLALLAVQRADVAAAEEQYGALGSAKGIMLWWLISGDRLLGLLAQTMGNLDFLVTRPV